MKTNAILTTERLTLVPLSLDHSDTLFKIWSDKKVTEYMNIQMFTNIKQAEEMISFLISLTKEDRATRYTIINEAQQIIGSIGLNTIDDINLRAEIGYELSQHHWGKGYATELLNGYLDYEAKQRDIHRFEAFIVPDNISSIKLVEKVGFVYEATLKDYEYKNEQFHDILLYRKIY